MPSGAPTSLSMGSGNVGDQLIVIHTLITSCSRFSMPCFSCSVCFFCPTAAGITFHLVVFDACTAPALWCAAFALSSRINRRSTQKKIELNQGNDHSNSVANYLANATLEERRADDIRIGHFDHFLDTQFERPWNISCRCTSTPPASPPSQTEKNALLSAPFQFRCVPCDRRQALYGVLPIGDVLLYAGSVTRAMSDLQTFLATRSEFDYINSYLSTYEGFPLRSRLWPTTVHCRLRNATTAITNLHSTMSHSLLSRYEYSGTRNVTLSFAVGEKPPSLRP